MKFFLKIIAICFLFTQIGFAQIDNTLQRTLIENYRFQDANGKKVRLSDFKGKVVVLDFWASWCQSCIVSFPTNQNIMQGEFYDKPVVLLTINVDANKSAFKKAVKQHKPPGIVVYAKPKHKIKKKLAVTFLPRYALIDKKGKLYSPKTRSLYEEKQTVRDLMKE
ncbi:MAG: TlpA family protein disulfide reductase [Bacteroidia bacterium]